MRIKHLLLLLSLALNIAIIASLAHFAGKMGGPNHLWFRLTHNGASGIEEGRQSLFVDLAEPRGGIVMVGDSLTHNAEWNELLGLPNVINRGIIGQWTGQLVEEEDYISPLKPETVFLMMGVNDILAAPPEDVAVVLQKAVERIKRNSPDTRLFVQSVLPVNNNQRRTGRKNADVLVINEKMQTYCAREETPCDYIELHKHFVDAEGRMDPRYSTDGVHLNAEGYQLWTRLIQPYVAETGKAELTAF